MRNVLAKVLTIAPIALILLGVAVGFSGTADAKKETPAIVTESVRVIKESQLFVQEYEAKVQTAKSRAQTFRGAICKDYSEYCTKENLDPAGSGVDLSVFLVQPQ